MVIILEIDMEGDKDKDKGKVPKSSAAMMHNFFSLKSSVPKERCLVYIFTILILYLILIEFNSILNAFTYLIYIAMAASL